MKQLFARWVFKHLAADPNEHCSIPGSECELSFGEIDNGKSMFTATTYNNDGYELWICYTNEGRWITHFGDKEARQLAWFILWNWWTVSKWFGLKRKIWYWSLRTTMESDKRRYMARTL